MNNDNDKERKPTTREWLEANKDNYPKTWEGWNNWISDCITSLGVQRKNARNVSRSIWKCPGKEVLEKRSSNLTRSEFKAQHDARTRTYDSIKDAVERLLQREKELPEDKDSPIDDYHFRTEWCLGAAHTLFRQIASSLEFKKHQFCIGTKVFWATPRTKAWALKEITKARDV